MSDSLPKSRNIGSRLFRFFSSFGLAIFVLTSLLIITLAGTLSQKDIGLLDSQRKYFESWFLWFSAGEWSIPFFPGGLLLMILLFVNMLCGAIIRMRKGWRTIGVLISHLAIVFMLAAGFVSFISKTEGAMPLYEGQTSDQYQSYHQRTIEIRRYDANGQGDKQAMIIPMKQFWDLAPGKARTFHGKNLPFELTVTGYQRNARVVPATGNPNDVNVVDGFRVQPIKIDTTDERNTSTLYATVTPKDGSPPVRGILWEAGFVPWTVKAGDASYTIALSRMKWNLPFAIKLTDFQRELHPGTMKAKRFTSHAIKIKDGVEEPKVVTMNVPVRDSGFVVYQASFSMDTDGERSVFTVASNPADKWPLWSCIAVAIGLSIHFIMHFARFLKRALQGASTRHPPPPLPT